MSQAPLPTVTFRFDRSGRWSGGGQVFLRNVEHAELRHELLRGGVGEIPVIARNVPPRGVIPKGPFILAPQNAWPWTPTFAGLTELRRITALRLASEIFLRRANGVMRISSSIPSINPNSSPVIHNVLDTGFDEALVESSNVPVPELARGAFVTLGSVNSYRNLVNLVRGYKRYREAGGVRRLWIAGPPGSAGARGEIELAAEATTGVTIRWQALRRAECLAVLRAAAAVVLPSRVEASPVAALEAAASNVNVILSRIVGHTEILSEYGAVPRDCLFDPISPDDIARTLGIAEAQADAASGALTACHDALTNVRLREGARVSWGDHVAGWLGRLRPALTNSKRRAQSSTSQRKQPDRSNPETSSAGDVR